MTPGRYVKSVLWMVLGVGVLSVLAGCVSTARPSWILKGGGAFPEQEKQVFYGVGSIQGVDNRSLARTAADNRARAEIAKILGTYTAALMRDYASATTANDIQRSTQEQHIENTLKTVTIKTVSGVEVIDRWIDEDGTIYSLARLHLAAFKTNVEGLQELHQDVRDYIRQHADQAFDTLSKEERQQAR